MSMIERFLCKNVEFSCFDDEFFSLLVISFEFFLEVRELLERVFGDHVDQKGALSFIGLVRVVLEGRSRRKGKHNL